jgi:hypothetical protein
MFLPSANVKLFDRHGLQVESGAGPPPHLPGFNRGGGSQAPKQNASRAAFTTVLIKPLPIWVLRLCLLIEHYVNVSWMSKGSRLPAGKSPRFLAGTFSFSFPINLF